VEKASLLAKKVKKMYTI